MTDNPRVLVVDDDAGIREALTDLLTEEGMEVVGTTDNGEAAIALAGSLAPDVVLMDLRMPEVDGLQATKEIRAAYAPMQVIILSAYDDPALTKGADEAGAYAYLVKGCSAALVRDVVLNAFNLKKGLEAREASGA